ncbi:MAG: hypothetical protein ACD_60C00166G0010 [uncultured bacterium]|nr:MAG: hypothetical protein ACD_60C00166G0010 [uncultured bacterium]
MVVALSWLFEEEVNQESAHECNNECALLS